MFTTAPEPLNWYLDKFPVYLTFHVRFWKKTLSRTVFIKLNNNELVRKKTPTPLIIRMLLLWPRPHLNTGAATREKSSDLLRVNDVILPITLIDLNCNRTFSLLLPFHVCYGSIIQQVGTEPCRYCDLVTRFRTIFTPVISTAAFMNYVRSD